MSKEQEELENESQAKGASQSGNAGRVFLTLLILGLAGVTAAFAALKDGKFIQDLLARDEWTSQLIGNLHPILIMLPLGLIVMVVLLEIFGWLTFGKWKPATVAVLFFVVITAILASLSGLVQMELEGNVGPDWTQYLWYGVGATAAFALSFVCKIWGRDGNSRGLIYAVFLLGGTAALGYGGYIYGQKVHSYTLIPSETDLTTPFGNKKKMEMMTASISDLEASTTELESGLALKDQKISELTSAGQTAEENFLSEQKKLALAETSIAELKQGVTDAQKKTAEVQMKVSEAEKLAAETQMKVAKAQEEARTQEGMAAEAQTKIQASNTENEKLKQELNELKSQIEALKEKKEEVE